MIDIVDQLLDPAHTDWVQREAAAEIRRLRERIDTLDTHHEALRKVAKDNMARLKTQIEQLQSELKVWVDHSAQQADKIERLKEQNKRAATLLRCAQNLVRLDECGAGWNKDTEMWLQITPPPSSSAAPPDPAG